MFPLSGAYWSTSLHQVSQEKQHQVRPLVCLSGGKESRSYSQVTVLWEIAHKPKHPTVLPPVNCRGLTLSPWVNMGQEQLWVFQAAQTDQLHKLLVLGQTSLCCLSHFFCGLGHLRQPFAPHVKQRRFSHLFLPHLPCQWVINCPYPERQFLSLALFFEVIFQIKKLKAAINKFLPKQVHLTEENKFYSFELISFPSS